jgi:hypothetical protein
MQAASAVEAVAAPVAPAAPPAGRAIEASAIVPVRSEPQCADESLTPTCSAPPSPLAEQAAAQVARAAAPLPLATSDTALAQIAPDFPRDQLAVLRYAAHATAAASVCSNFELNTPAVVGTVSNLAQATSFGLPPAQAASRRESALIAYGMLTGLLLQEASADREAFCRNATDYAGTSAWSFIRVSEQR